jgi:predicted metal-dependent peptidase
MAKQRTAEQRIEKARALTMVYFGFYGTLIANLDWIEDTSGVVDTMATDGKRVFWCRAYVDQMADDELIFVMAHEAGHCSHLHHVRRGDRDPLVWNISGDYVLNAGLVASGVGRMPEGGLYDARYVGWSTEEVYRDQMKQREQKQQQSQQSGSQEQDGEDAQQSGPSGSGSDSGQSQKSKQQKKSGSHGQPDAQKPADASGGGGVDDQTSEEKAASEALSRVGSDPGRCGQVIDATFNPAEAAEEEDRWQTITRQAVAVAKRAGQLPADAAQLLSEIGKAKEDWREVMRRFVTQSSRSDLSYSRPDRRFPGADFILPGLVSDGVAHVVEVLDTSGSIFSHKEALKAFAAESQSLLDEGGIDKLTVVMVDTKVQSVVEYVSGEQISFDIKGGGGTSFKPAWQWLEDNASDAAAVVYFTDLEPSDGFGEEPLVPVLWAAYGESRFRQEPPFGQVVEVRD